MSLQLAFYHSVFLIKINKYIIILSISIAVLLNTKCSAQINRYPKENWCIQKASDQDNNLIFITSNLGYKDYQYKKEYPWFLWVNITTIEQNDNGHPTAKEAVQLNLTEDIITETLQKTGVVHYIGRTTVKGHRELLYFLADPEKANAALSRLSRKKQPREWEYRMEEDEEWQHVKSFLDNPSECL